jgi:hypothetical protein
MLVTILNILIWSLLTVIFGIVALGILQDKHLPKRLNHWVADHSDILFTILIRSQYATLILILLKSGIVAIKSF